MVAKDYKGLLEQPKEPKFKGALVQIYVRSQPYGGSDKSNNGNRYDSIPFANGMINAGMSCQLIHYTHQERFAIEQLSNNMQRSEEGGPVVAWAKVLTRRQVKCLQDSIYGVFTRPVAGA